MMICPCALLLFQHNAEMLFGLQLFPYYAQHNRLNPVWNVVVESVPTEFGLWAIIMAIWYFQWQQQKINPQNFLRVIK